MKPYDKAPFKSTTFDRITREDVIRKIGQLEVERAEIKGKNSRAQDLDLLIRCYKNQLSGMV